jgi:hypothetical protein
MSVSHIDGVVANRRFLRLLPVKSAKIGPATLRGNKFLILHSQQCTAGNTPLVKPIVVGYVRAGGRT